MSNPLLNPQDDRFRRPTLPADGSHPYKEEAAAFENPLITPPPAANPEHYEQVYKHRGTFLTILAGIGVALQLTLILTLFSFSILWLVLALSGVFPCLIVCVLATLDLTAMRAGAMDDSGIGMTRAAFWLALTGTIMSMVILVPMIVAMFLLFLW